MKAFLTNKITKITLPIITIVFLAFYVYMLVRPISYNMDYYCNETFEGMVFESTYNFHPGNKLTFINSNFETEQELYYYYKDGYVFNCMATNEEEYKQETESIDSNFDQAVNTPFYASNINAFTLTSTMGDISIQQTCKGAVIFAISGGIAEICLISLTAIMLIFNKKYNLIKEN